MQARMILAGTVLAMASGCGSTVDLYREPMAARVRIVRQAAEHQEVRVLLESWKSVEGRAIRIDDEGLTLAEDPDGTIRHFAWTGIRSLTVGQRSDREGAGMTRGALYGGIAAGLVGGAASGRIEGAVIGAGVGALAGAVTGMTGAMDASGGGEYRLREPYDRFDLRAVTITRIEQETPEALAIRWRGMTIWLPKRHTTVEPQGDLLRITAPRRLFETPPEPGGP